MKKLFLLLFSVMLFACAERQADPREAIILSFLDKLTTDTVSPALFQSDYFVPELPQTNLQTLTQIKELMAESREIKVMTYAEAESRAEDIPYLDEPQSANLFVIKMNDRYAFCTMKEDKIESLLLLFKMY
jgi:hypothetical protein